MGVLMLTVFPGGDPVLSSHSRSTLLVKLGSQLLLESNKLCCYVRSVSQQNKRRWHWSVLTDKFPDRFQRRGSSLRNKATQEEFDLSDPATNPMSIVARLVQVWVPSISTCQAVSVLASRFCEVALQLSSTLQQGYMMCPAT